MTSNYNAPTAAPAPGNLPGFTQAQPQYSTPELAEAANYAVQRWGNIYLKNRQAIDETLRQMQAEHYIDPRKFVDGVVAAAVGVETLTAQQANQPAPGSPDDPYTPTSPKAPPSLTAPVDLSRLPEKYRQALEHRNIDAKTVDEFLQATLVKSAVEPTLERARARWVREVMRGDVDGYDGHELQSKILGSDG